MNEEYLKKYRKNAHIVFDNISELPITAQWIEILGTRLSAVKCKKVISLWELVIGDYLPNVIEYLRNHLIDVNLLDSAGSYSVIYSIRRNDGKIIYYEGKILSEEKTSLLLKNYSGKIPESLQNFYLKINNGFVYFASQNMGLRSIDTISKFDFSDFEVIDDLSLTVKLSYDSTFSFLDSGMGAYLLIDLTKPDAIHSSCVWFDDDYPQYECNFWKVLDEWIIIGFES